jgi:type VI secretion system secreted protein VgrG
VSARPFELRTTDLGPDDLLVGRLRGEERLSRPYAFDLTLHAANGLARSFHGVLAKVCAEAVVPGQTRAVYTVRLVPRLWLASLGKDSRIFQELSVPEIVDLVLAPHGVTTRWKLARTYPKRDYCVQHHESDLAFVTRLLAEEGLFYFLDGVDGEDKVVVCDLAAHYEPILGARAVPFRDPSEGASAEHVESLVFARS